MKKGVKLNPDQMALSEAGCSGPVLVERGYRIVKKLCTKCAYQIRYVAF